ncbi:MAG: SGNH/GDSL hydrolase family protein, partial [Candidatus Helarchaeota archaeon]
YVIAIGTNDVRYREKTTCAMDSASYVENIDNLITSIRETNSNAKFVLVSPWLALDNDPYTTISIEERDYLLDEYGKALEVFSNQNGHHFINPNLGIDYILSHEVVSKFLLDHIHPNADSGIRLYSQEIISYSANN